MRSIQIKKDALKKFKMVIKIWWKLGRYIEVGTHTIVQNFFLLPKFGENWVGIKNGGFLLFSWFSENKVGRDTGTIQINNDPLVKKQNYVTLTH